jgi:D-xylose transport system permease protein
MSTEHRPSGAGTDSRTEPGIDPVTGAATGVPDAAAFATDLREPSVRDAVHDYWRRVKGGDLGPLPAILGLLTLFVLFSALRWNTFPTPLNIANLMVQALPIAILAMGLIFVLLLGEIDLAAGVTGGVCAGLMAKLLVGAQPWYVAIAAAIVTGVAIGFIIGQLVARLGIPSFVVTLAFFLGLQGVTLRLIGEGGTVRINEPIIQAIAGGNVPVPVGWALAWIAVLGYGLFELVRYRRKRARGLARTSSRLVIGKVAVVGLTVLALTAILSQDRALAVGVFLGGVPWGVVLVGVLLLGCTFVLGRTAFGRHIYAVGGNAEAARRAGIPVARIRIYAFMIAAGIAAISGIVAASRLQSATPDAGSRTELLLAVGAAVIGGTSLFGGKGRARDAILGGLVIAVIDNGLGLLGFKAYANLLITGGVLLLAASVDALARRRRTATGR